MSIKSIINSKIQEAIECYDFEQQIEDALDSIDITELVTDRINDLFENEEISIMESVEDYIRREIDSISFEDLVQEAIDEAIDSL